MMAIQVRELPQETLIRRTIKNSLSGTVAGIAVCLVGHPFDTLKVRLQTQSFSNPVYSGLIDCFVKTMKWEGISGLYKGVCASTIWKPINRAVVVLQPIRVIPLMFANVYPLLFRNSELVSGLMKELYFIKAVFFVTVSDCWSDVLPSDFIYKLLSALSLTHSWVSSYDLVGTNNSRGVLFLFSSMLADKSKPGQRLQHHQYFIAGAATGFVASFFESPIDLFKTKMQIQIMRAKSGEPMQYKSVLNACNVIARQHGIRGVFQGLPATFLRDTPAYGIYFGFYELFKFYFTPVGGTAKDVPSWAVFISGGAAGFLFWFLTYPTDVIKSSMQSDDSDPTKRKFRSIVHCARELYTKEGGIKRLFKGFSPCLLRSVPANATMLFTLETCRRLIDPYL